MFYLHAFLCTTRMPDALGSQKKVLEQLEFINRCEPSHGYWEPNGGPLQEQPALLAAEPQHLALTVWIKQTLT